MTSLGILAVKRMLASNPSIPKNPLFFQIWHHDSTYLFAAPEEANRREWVDVINSYINKKTVSKSIWGGSMQENKVYSSLEKDPDLMKTIGTFMDDDDDDDDGSSKSWISMDSLIRVMKVISAYPFVIVVATTNLSNKYALLKSTAVIRVMNLAVYILPVIFVKLILSQSNYLTIQRIAMAVYLFLYLFPVGMVVSHKLNVSSSTSKIEEGTFCFKPSCEMRHNMANYSLMSGFVLEWLIHSIYVFPLGILTANKGPTTLNQLPPYLEFRVYFWIAFSFIVTCSFILILNTVLRGKLHYRFNKSNLVWFFYFNMGHPCNYMTSICTVMFMGLQCDYSVNPPVLIQDHGTVCWASNEHSTMSICALLGLAVFLVQMTLLPAGAFKETMTDNDLDLTFVPVYLQAHSFLKAIFSGVYVSFYSDNLVRVTICTFINMLLLALNIHMRPCSIESVNTIRNAFFVSSVLSGIQSINYIAWNKNHFDSSEVYLSHLFSNILLACLGLYAYHRSTASTVEYNIASAFLNLEWQVRFIRVDLI